MKRILFSVTFLLLLHCGFAQKKPDFSWLQGTWNGPGFGGTFEEVWAAPDANGKTMGMFRFIDEKGAIQFYEFWVLDETGMKLKHFNPDFVGWEEKDGFIDFSMISAEKNKLTLKGLIYELQSDGTMKITLDMKHGDKVETEVFHLKKVK